MAQDHNDERKLIAGPWLRWNDQRACDARGRGPIDARP
jgi:hypothetical protein